MKVRDIIPYIDGAFYICMEVKTKIGKEVMIKFVPDRNYISIEVLTSNILAVETLGEYIKIIIE